MGNAERKDLAVQEEPMQNSDDKSYVAIIPTLTGQRVNLLNTDPNTIRPVDFIHSLKTCYRYNGMTKVKISVLEHTLKLIFYVEFLRDCLGMPYPDNLIRYIAIHDVTEAYMGEMVRPIKISFIGKGYRNVENVLLGCILEKYKIDVTNNITSCFPTLDSSFCVAEIIYAKLLGNSDERIKHFTTHQLLEGENMFKVWNRDQSVYSTWGWDPEVAATLYLEMWSRYFAEYPLY